MRPQEGDKTSEQAQQQQEQEEVSSDGTDYGLEDDDELDRILGDEEEDLEKILAEMRVSSGDIRELTMDDVFEKIGGFGPFQRNLTLVLAFTFGLVPAMSAFINIFTTPEDPPGTCHTDTTSTITTFSSCINGTFTFSNPNTITAEFSLVGDKEWLVGFLNTGFFAGHAVGGLVFGVMSDTIGRYDTVIFTAVLTAVLNLISICCFTYWIFWSIRVLYGMANAALMLSSWVLMVESWGPEQRHSISNIAHLPAPLGMVAIVALAKAIPQWRILVLAESIIQVLICFWFSKALAESPRWLMANQQQAEATTILRRVAQENGKQLPRSFPPRLNTKDSQAVCAHPLLCKRFLALMLVWLVVTLAMFGLNFGSETIHKDPHINLCILAGLEAAAYISGLVVVRHGRRSALVGYLLLSSASLFASTMAYPRESIRICFLCIAKFSVSGALNVVFLFTAEMFPTTSRNTVLGLCAAMGRVGATVAPLFTQLAKMERTLPLNVFGQMMLVGALGSLTFPETADLCLPDVVADVESPAHAAVLPPKSPHIKPGTGGEMEFPGL